MAFKRILCAVDFSEESVAAFDRAVELARLSSARLLVLHAMENQPVISRWVGEDALGEATVRMNEETRRSMRRLLDSSGDRLGDLEVETEISSGRAFVEILENSRVWNADLIVLGSRGVASLDQVLMGSTAERVLKSAECSVLVVKNDSS